MDISKELARLSQSDAYWNLPEDVRRETLLALDVGAALIPTEAGMERPRVAMTEREELLLQETVKAHDSQIGTLLGVITGPTGNSGMAGDIKDIKNLLSSLNDKLSKLDKDQAVMDEKNVAEHSRMKGDIDGIGRKAAHAAEKADKVEDEFEKYRKEQIDRADAEIDKKKESKFQWYHAALGGIGAILVVLQILQMVG